MTVLVLGALNGLMNSKMRAVESFRYVSKTHSVENFRCASKANAAERKNQSVHRSPGQHRIFPGTICMVWRRMRRKGRVA